MLGQIVFELILLATCETLKLFRHLVREAVPSQGRRLAKAFATIVAGVPLYISMNKPMVIQFVGRVEFSLAGLTLVVLRAEVAREIL